MRGGGAPTLVTLVALVARGSGHAPGPPPSLVTMQPRQQQQQRRTQPTTTTSGSCPSPGALAGFCTGARHASAGNCLVCVTDRFPGACTGAEMDAFCGKDVSPAAAAVAPADPYPPLPPPSASNYSLPYTVFYNNAGNYYGQNGKTFDYPPPSYERIAPY
jgi:hypothetical protein